VRWWTAFIWLRIRTGGGLDSFGSGYGPVVDWIHLAQDRDRWCIVLIWFRIRTDGGLDSSGSGYGPVVDFSEHGAEHSGSIEDREFLDRLSDYQVFNKESAPSRFQLL
jgi:hypothetical protein